MKSTAFEREAPYPPRADTPAREGAESIRSGAAGDALPCRGSGKRCRSSTTASAISGGNGVYVLCNVPVGSAVEITAQGPDGGTVAVTDVEIRPGTISWYDLLLGRRR